MLELQQFIENNKRSVFRDQCFFKYSNEKGKWIAVTLDGFLSKVLQKAI